jgi:anion-transporting  ArsA/GET3 family ATPase
MSINLSSKQLIFVTGKGGVGKTTLTAALSLGLAAQGRRVLAVELSSGCSLARRFGHVEASYAPQEVAEGLHTCRISPEECLREYGLMKLKFRRFYRAVFENPFVRSLVSMTPGMEELLLLGKLGNVNLAMAKGRARAPWDVVVVDAPPTGQGTGLFALPTIILGAVSAGPLAKETRKLQELLQDENRTAILIVSTPEELAVNEALEQVAGLRDAAHLPVRAIVANRVLPGLQSKEDEEVLRTFAQARRTRRDLGGTYPLVSTALRMLGLRRQQESELTRLRRSTTIPIVEVPLVPEEGPAEDVQGQLERALAPLLGQEE